MADETNVNNLNGVPNFGHGMPADGVVMAGITDVSNLEVEAEAPVDAPEIETPAPEVAPEPTPEPEAVDITSNE